jgi:hypothetical protein
LIAKGKYESVFDVAGGFRPMLTNPGAYITNASKNRSSITMSDFNGDECVIPYGMTVRVDEFGQFVPTKARQRRHADQPPAAPGGQADQQPPAPYEKNNIATGRDEPGEPLPPMDLAARLAAARESSAGRAAPSVAEARRMYAAEQAAGSQEVLALMERARAAEEDGKPNVAKLYYQMVIRRASGELKQQAQDRLDAIHGASTQ